MILLSNLLPLIFSPLGIVLILLVAFIIKKRLMMFELDAMLISIKFY